jgi:hypothetical protein
MHNDGTARTSDCRWTEKAGTGTFLVSPWPSSRKAVPASYLLPIARPIKQQGLLELLPVGALQLQSPDMSRRDAQHR